MKLARKRNVSSSEQCSTSRCSKRWVSMFGHRELLAPPHRPQERRAAAVSAGLLPRRLLARRRRVARDDLADRRDVPRRPFSRKETLVRSHGFRLPSRPGQPAAEVRRVGRPGRASDLPERDSGRLRARALRPMASVVEQIIRPTGLLDPTRIIRPPDVRVRSTTCSTKSAFADRCGTNGCWSRR